MRDILEVIAVALAFGALCYWSTAVGLDHEVRADCAAYCSDGQATDFCVERCR